MMGAIWLQGKEGSESVYYWKKECALLQQSLGKSLLSTVNKVMATFQIYDKTAVHPRS